MHVKRGVPEIEKILKATFSDFTGKDVSVEVFSGPMDLDSYWSEGSRDWWVFLNTTTGEAQQVADNHPYFNAGAPRRLNALPPDVVLVQSAWRGTWGYIVIYVNEANMNRLALPAPVHLTMKERIVLAATGLKSSYAGISNYRMHSARKDTGISVEDYEAAKASLITKGLLNRAGAITVDGRNARGNDDLWKIGFDIKQGKTTLDNPRKGTRTMGFEERGLFWGRRFLKKFKGFPPNLATTLHDTGILYGRTGNDMTFEEDELFSRGVKEAYKEKAREVVKAYRGNDDLWKLGYAIRNGETTLENPLMGLPYEHRTPVPFKGRLLQPAARYVERQLKNKKRKKDPTQADYYAMDFGESFITFGNKKIAKNVGIFDLPAGDKSKHGTCGQNCPKCYAIRDAEGPNGEDVQVKRFRNLDISLKPWFVDAVKRWLLKNGHKITALRVHSSGDFYSQAYVDKWWAIADWAGRQPGLKHIRFYCYTKRMKAFDLSGLMALKNFVVIDSFGWTDEKGRPLLNYGDEAYLTPFAEQAGKDVICPCGFEETITKAQFEALRGMGAKENSKICGTKCTRCQTKVAQKFPTVFLIH